MEQKSKYLSIDEVMEVIEKLTLSDNKKLLFIGKKFCQINGLGDEADSLVQEALLRVWKGTRHIPRDVNIVKAIGNIMWSIAGDHKDKKFRKNELLYESPDEDIQESSLGFALSPCPTEMISAEQTVTRITQLFKSDIYVNALIQGYSANMKQQQIIESIFKGDKKTFEAARKRFRRGITKIKEEGA